MHLILLRHAHAGDRDPARWPDDTLRPLSDRGRKTQARVARAMRRLDIAPTLLFTSPWLRAVQTAEIVADELGLGPAAQVPSLAAPPDLAEIEGDLGERGADDVVLLVGHSPFLDDLAGALLGSERARVAIDFPKSGLLALETPGIAAGAATLRFFLRPKQAERIAQR